MGWETELAHDWLVFGIATVKAIVDGAYLPYLASCMYAYVGRVIYYTGKYVINLQIRGYFAFIRHMYSVHVLLI